MKEEEKDKQIIGERKENIRIVLREVFNGYIFIA